jgi:hypothetical protein
LEALIRSRLGASTPPPEDPRWQADGRDPSETRGGTSRARRSRENEPRAPHVLSDAEIKRALLRYRYDRAYRGERRVPIKTLAEYIGLSHETVYQAMRGKVSDGTRAKLSWALTAINDRRLQFRRHGQRWQVDIAGPLLSNGGH